MEGVEIHPLHTSNHAASVLILEALRLVSARLEAQSQRKMHPDIVPKRSPEVRSKRPQPLPSRRNTYTSYRTLYSFSPPPPSALHKKTSDYTKAQSMLIRIVQRKRNKPQHHCTSANRNRTCYESIPNLTTHSSRRILTTISRTQIKQTVAITRRKETKREINQCPV